MRLYEHEAKGVMKEYDIPVPRGEIASTGREAQEIAERLGGAVCVKAQVLVGGRGKAGAIAVVETPLAAREASERILGMTVKGSPVERVLVEEAIPGEDEYYLGITADRTKGRAVVMASAEGGVDIEDLAERSPEKIIRYWADPYEGLPAFQARKIAIAAGFRRDVLNQAGILLSSLYRLFVECDATIAEINPLMVSQGGAVTAADAKIDVDDNAIFRHPALAGRKAARGGHPLEVKAAEKGLTYVRLDGEIGVVGNGAGLVMTTLDMISRKGGSAANFLDIGGGARATVVREGLNLIAEDPRVKAVLMNIFGGITRCDEVARGLIEALPDVKRSLPTVIRLRGTAEDEGLRLLLGYQSDAGRRFTVVSDMEEAAGLAVDYARGGGRPNGHSPE